MVSFFYSFREDQDNTCQESSAVLSIKLQVTKEPLQSLFWLFFVCSPHFLRARSPLLFLPTTASSAQTPHSKKNAMKEQQESECSIISHQLVPGNIAFLVSFTSIGSAYLLGIDLCSSIFPKKLYHFHEPLNGSYHSWSCNQLSQVVRINLT